MTIPTDPQLDAAKETEAPMTARTVTIRAKTRYRFGDQTVLVFESGEMFVKEHVHGALQFVESHRAGLTDAARRRAWKASGYRRGGR